jgi:CheY-like chemotaxis protein
MALPGHPLRLLLVEDDRVGALLFSQALLQAPWIHLRVAEDGAEALALAASWAPQALLLDAHLPDTNGHQLLHALRALPGLARVPAWMCSADDLPEDLARAAASGFSGYWGKPLDMPAILAALRGLAQAPG